MCEKSAKNKILGISFLSDFSGASLRPLVALFFLFLFMYKRGGRCKEAMEIETEVKRKGLKEAKPTLHRTPPRHGSC